MSHNRWGWGGALPPVEPIDGQLELVVEVEQEPSCRWAHGPVVELDRRGLCRVCAEDDE